jgi:hypothetical protein
MLYIQGVSLNVEATGYCNYGMVIIYTYMHTIIILDGSTNSMLNINVKCTIYKVEQIKIYPFECTDIYIMGKYKKR